MADYLSNEEIREVASRSVVARLGKEFMEAAWSSLAEEGYAGEDLETLEGIHDKYGISPRGIIFDVLKTRLNRATGNVELYNGAACALLDQEFDVREF